MLINDIFIQKIQNQDGAISIFEIEFSEQFLPKKFTPPPLMENNNDDDTIPMEYLNNENPYAYCRDYHKNAVNLQDRKVKVNALQRMQPLKIGFRMPQKHLEREKYSLIETATANQRNILIIRGLSIMGIHYHDNPEELFEQNIHIEPILDIALQLKKLKLVHQQRKLRSKVASALSKNIEYNVNTKGCLEIDNLKDALIYCKLEDLYEEKK